MRRLVAAVTAIALTPGCATMFHGTSETIRVRSEVPDTTFYAGAQEIGKGSNAVTSIEKKALKKTTLRAEKPNCNPKTTPLMTAFDGISLLGIILDFGLISVLVVDGAATGAWTHATQTDYILTPECSDGSVPVASPSEPSLPAATPTKAPAGKPREPAPRATVTGSVPSANSSPEVPPTPAPGVSTSASGRVRVMTDPAGARVYVG